MEHAQHILTLHYHTEWAFVQFPHKGPITHSHITLTVLQIHDHKAKYMQNIPLGFCYDMEHQKCIFTSSVLVFNVVHLLEGNELKRLINLHYSHGSQPVGHDLVRGLDDSFTGITWDLWKTPILTLWCYNIGFSLGMPRTKRMSYLWGLKIKKKNLSIY